MTSIEESEIIPASQRDIAGEKKQIDLVNAEGAKIFADFTERLKQPEFSRLDPQSQYEYYMKIYPDFARSNPIVLRYITLNMFSEKAVFLYLMRCYERPIKTNKDYCERQADYVKYLYRCTTQIRGKQLDDIWIETRDLLMHEIEEFDKERERIKAERLARQDANDEIKRESIKAAFVKQLNELRAQVLANCAASKSETETENNSTSVQEATPDLCTSETDPDVSLLPDKIPFADQMD